MKKTVSFLVFIFESLIIFAQPQGINYQGVARDSVSRPVINQLIGIKLSILDSSNTGQAVYVETHIVTTNASGLFNLSIGMGSVVSGVFANIPWAQGNKWLKVEVDASGSSNYQLIGTTQFMSVPYSLYAGNGINPGNSTGEMLYWNGTSWATIPVGNSGQVLTLTGNIPGWKDPIISIGNFYQGGYIVYLLGPSDQGYDPNLVHGLIVAPLDQSLGIKWRNVSFAQTTGATATTIGTGSVNTASIVNTQGIGDYAAQLCYDLVLNGYTDWYLPSLDELKKIYLFRASIGSFANVYYWSSSEIISYTAWAVYFGSGIPSTGDKVEPYRVVAVRSF